MEEWAKTEDYQGCDTSCSICWQRVPTQSVPDDVPTNTLASLDADSLLNAVLDATPTEYAHTSNRLQNAVSLEDVGIMLERVQVHAAR